MYNGTSKLEKTIDTWIKKQFINQLLYPKKNQKITLKSLLAFLEAIYNQPQRKYISLIAKIYKSKKKLYTARIRRIDNSPKLQELKQTYPHLNISEAYKYGILSEILSLTTENIEIFTNLLEILGREIN